MIRVLHCLGGLSRGGIETFIMNVYRKIDRSEIQFDFLVQNGGDYEGEILDLGGRIYKLPSRSQGIIQYRKNLRQFFEDHACEYQAIHQHAATLSSIEPLIYARKYKIPIRIIHSHSSTVKTSRLHYLLHYINKLKIGNIATTYFACSEAALKWFYGKTPLAKRAVLIKNGIDSQDFSFNPNKRLNVRKALGLTDELVIGHVGSFIPVKNHTFLLDIFKEIKNLEKNSILLLIGDGPLAESIRTKINDLNLTDSVKMLGIRGDVNNLLQAIDVIVMPSLFEGMPVSLIEAQASDCIVACSDTISPDTKITKKFMQIPLSTAERDWAIKIKETFDNNNRYNTSNEIKTAGFDISNTSDILTKFYLKKS